MPKTAATIETLNKDVESQNEQIYDYRVMVESLPVEPGTEPARQYFAEAITKAEATRNSIKERLDRLVAEAASEKYREELIRQFGFTNVATIGFTPRSFSIGEAQERFDEAALRISELNDQSKLYKRAMDTVGKMGISEEEAKALPRFAPVLSQNGERAILVMGRRSAGAERTPRAAEVIESVDRPIADVTLVGAQIHGEPMEGRTFYSSWYKMAKTLNEAGHFTEEQWAATQTKDGEARQMSFREFMVQTLGLKVVPLAGATPAVDNDEEDDEDTNV